MIKPIIETTMVAAHRMQRCRLGVSRRLDMHDTRSLDDPRDLESLSPKKLASTFATEADVTRNAIQALHQSLVGGTGQDATAFNAWKTLVSGACGHQVERASAGTTQLGKCYGIPVDRVRPAEILFAVQTYYALLVKLLVWQTLAAKNRLPLPAESMVSAPSSDRLRQIAAELEAGSVFDALDVAGLLAEDHFSWYLAAWDESIESMLRQLAAEVNRRDPAAFRDYPPAGRDLFKSLYESLFPRGVRHKLGEYYTPQWLAEHVLDRVGYQGQPETRLLDPACGSGTFLMAAIKRIRRAYAAECGNRGLPGGELCREILDSVVGFDLNPVAVLSARANYLLAICDLLGQTGRVEIPVSLCDSILSRPDDVRLAAGRFDYVVGNPPWIAWDDLPDEYRQATKPLWEQYGLFSLSGSDARHGGGKKDLSMLMLYTAADRYLKQGGRLSMVITQTLFQTKGAGDGFRRFRLGPEGQWLRLIAVDDMVDLKPFRGAANWTATISLEKGSPTEYPLPYVKWYERRNSAGSQEASPDRFVKRVCQAEPIDPDRPSSPWFVRPEGLSTDFARMIGPSDYQAHLGANSGGANGVYWLELLKREGQGVLVKNIPARGKREVSVVQQVIEPDLLYPLLRWADVSRYRALPETCLLLAQNPDTRKGIDEALIRDRYPKTYVYLKRFTKLLTLRAAYKRYQENAPFYSMYNVGPYTVAPHKVVWRRMDKQINAAVVEEIEHPMLGLRPVIPQETCVLIAAGSSDEAHYLCGMLNSSVIGFLVTSHSVRGGKGFGTPSMLDFIRLRRFAPHHARHVELTALSREAHQAVRRGDDYREIQRRIDELVGRLWGLTERETGAICREINGDQT